MWNELPVKVEFDGNFLPVTQGAVRSFYWIGREGNADDEKYLHENLDPELEQGICVILQNKERRMMAVKIGGCVYGEILPSYDEKLYEDQ